MAKQEFDIKSLPANLKAIGETLRDLGYGFFKMPQLGSDIYGLSPPPLPGSNRSTQTTIVPRSAMRMLLTEAARGQLMLKMADPRWGNLIYGRGANFSRVRAAGCGPTSLAIIMNYLLRTHPSGSAIGPIQRKLPTSKDFDVEKLIREEPSFVLNSYPDTKGLVLDIVNWAGANPRIRPGPDERGRLSGTSGSALAKNLKHKFQGFGAELIKDTKKVVTLLRRGELLMVGGRQRGWRSREALIRDPNSPDANQYDAHFVVLWGADQALYRNNIQILWVIDSANFNNTRAIQYTTLNMHRNKRFIYIYRSPEKNLIDCLLP
jgi:hypothetical protein